MATVCVWDENWDLIAEVTQGWRCDEPNVIVVPVDHPVAQWIIAQDQPDSHITVDGAGGARWSGRLDKFTYLQSDRGDEILYAAFSSHYFASAKEAILWGIQMYGDLTAMLPGLTPSPKSTQIVELERAVRAAQGHRAATYERLRGTYRNGHWHPKLADPRTLADRRLADAQNALSQALKSDS